MPHTLLLADDSVTIQRVIELTFADEEVTVVAVTDGNAALERLDSAPPDIVLADVDMPGKNGYEIADYIKHSPSLSHIPVVLLTGAFEPIDQVRAAEVGCNGVLAKPFEPQLVIKRVKELLGQPDRPAAAQPSTDVASGSGLFEGGEHGATGSNASDIADYFDRLDAAFASLSSSPRGRLWTSPPPEPEEASAPPPAAEEPPIIADSDADSDAASTVDDQIDWFAAQIAAKAAELPDLPLSFRSGSAQPEVEADVPPSVTLEADEQDVTPLVAVVADDHTAVFPIASSEPETESSPAALFDEDVLVAARSESAPRWAQAAPELDLDSERIPAVASPAVEPPPVAVPAVTLPEVAPPVAPSAIALPAVAVPAVAVPVVAPWPQEPVPLPPLADAFAAILAAEEGSVAATPSTWPAAAPSVDAFADEVSRLVLDRLTAYVDSIVRTAVADVVSELAASLIREEAERLVRQEAERLVREEIARIKASIQ